MTLKLVVSNGERIEPEGRGKINSIREVGQRELSASRGPRKVHTKKADVTEESASLRGSKDALRRQNQMATHDGLTRLRDHSPTHFRKVMEANDLVRLKDGVGLHVRSSMDGENRYCTYATRMFLKDLAANFYKEFHAVLTVTSALRSKEEQLHLREKLKNGNAASVSGPYATVHPTGAAVDITRRGLTKEQQAWMDARLKRYEGLKLIEATKEHRQPCYHVVVAEKYLKHRR
jgi:ribosomal protein S10